MTHPSWPLFDLRVRTPVLELRLPTDDDLVVLAEVAARGVHEPDFVPFLSTWSTLPPPERRRSILQWHWKARAEWKTEKWLLTLAVVRDGEVVGTQDMGGDDFPLLRTVTSESWLGLEHQGKGTGKEMRAAMLHLAFGGLGAEVAYSGAFADNAPSVGVSRGLGYVDNGDRILRRVDAPSREIRFKLERAVWEQRRRDDIEIVGLEPCLELFGLADDPGGGDQAG